FCAGFDTSNGRLLCARAIGFVQQANKNIPANKHFIGALREFHTSSNRQLPQDSEGISPIAARFYVPQRVSLSLEPPILSSRSLPPAATPLGKSIPSPACSPPKLFRDAVRRCIVRWRVQVRPRANQGCASFPLDRSARRSVSDLPRRSRCHYR